MKTLINGKAPALAIAAEVKRQIKELNPSIDPDSYENPDDIPGFKEIMQRPCGVGIDKTDEKRYRDVRRRMYLLQRQRKTAVIDFRRTKDGHMTVAALAKIRNKDGKLELQQLWEEEIGWEVFIE